MVCNPKGISGDGQARVCTATGWHERAISNIQVINLMSFAKLVNDTACRVISGLARAAWVPIVQVQTWRQ